MQAQKLHRKVKNSTFEEEKTLKVPFKNVSSGMLNVFEKDVVSEINNQYQDLYQLVKKKLNFDREKCTSEYFLIW